VHILPKIPSKKKRAFIYLTPDPLSLKGEGEFY
jgi:hypothetical protein